MTESTSETAGGKAAKPKKKQPATQRTKQEEKSNAGDGDAELAAAIEAAKPKKEATEQQKPISKRRKGQSPKVSKNRKAKSALMKTKPATEPSGKPKNGPDIVKEGVKAHNEAFAAKIQEHVNKFGGGRTRTALVNAIKGKGKTLTKNDRAEILKTLKESLAQGQPQIKGSQSIKEAMMKV